MTYFINGIFPGELKPSTTVGGCINIYENAWPDPEGTIKRAEAVCQDPNSAASFVKTSTFGNGQHQTHRTNYGVCISEVAMLYNDPTMQNIHNQFNMLLHATTIPYADNYGVEGPLYHEGYNLLRYADKQEYKAHCDGTSAIGRVISAICYLNDDYEGGELEFPNFDIKIKPTAGMLILFPSTYPYTHIAHPVQNGPKYNITTWLRDVPI